MEKQATFGRRRHGATQTAMVRRAPAAMKSLEINLTPEQRALILGPASGADIEHATLGGSIGWSRRAAFLALTIVSVLNTAVSLGVLQHQAASPLLKALGASGVASGALADASLPLALIAHLADGAFAGGTSLWLAHLLLRRLNQQSYAAYAAGGVTMAGIWTLVSAGLFGGILPAHMAITLATGGAATALYRLFAGRTG